MRMGIVLGVLAVGLAAILTIIGLRAKLVEPSALKFPVLVITNDRSNVLVKNDLESLTQARMSSMIVPQNGTIVIDSDFAIYTEQNVKCLQGEGGMLFRAFVRPGTPLTYQIQLKRDRKSGLAAVLGILSECSSLGWDSDRKRGEIAGQRTMEGIVAVINRGPPDGPELPVVDDGAATEPS